MQKRLKELEEGKAKPKLQRQNAKTKFDDEVTKDLKKKKTNKERGALLEYEVGEKERFVELGMLTIDGDFTAKIGDCPEGVCASAGASLTLKLEHVAYESENEKVIIKSETRVYGQIDASIGCGQGGCAVTATVEAGASTRAEGRHEL